MFALQPPKELANSLVVWYERYGTLTDGAFELYRSGEGLDTVDYLHALAKDRKGTDKYVPLDLLQVLGDSCKDIFGGQRRGPWDGTRRSSRSVRTDDEVRWEGPLDDG